MHISIKPVKNNAWKAPASVGIHVAIASPIRSPIKLATEPRVAKILKANDACSGTCSRIVVVIVGYVIPKVFSSWSTSATHNSSGVKKK